ncbi:MAG: hypothetical protein KBD37_10035 [Burkholderiales bacterium]|nr:hypothetical protein [Burkholderiales bacterium]
MQELTSYIHNVSIIYKHKLADIVDYNNKLHYVSDGLFELLGINPITHHSINLDDIKIYDNHDLSNIKKLNQRVIEKNKTIKFVSAGRLINDQYCVFHETKYPIVATNGSVLGVFTLIRLASAIHIEPKEQPHHQPIVFSLNNNKFNELDELIMFYSSIGFTQSEIYQSVINLGYEFTINGFKYHYNQLLIKSNAISITDIISNCDALKNKRFIPKMLIEKNTHYILL